MTDMETPPPVVARARRLLQLLWVIVLLIALAPAAWAAPTDSDVPRRPVQSTYPDLDSPDPQVRAAGVQAIRAARDTQAVSSLLAHIQDPDERVGLYVAQGLVELASSTDLLRLRAFLWGADANGRWRAAFVLGERRDSRAIPVLAHVLDDPEVLVGRTAAEGLAKIGGQAAINALVRGLYSDHPAEVMAARNGLLILGDAAVPALAKALDSGDREAEINATLVLEAIGTPAARAVCS